MPITFEPVRASIGLPLEAGAFGISFETGFRIQRFDLAGISPQVCIPENYVPPGYVDAVFPDVSFRNGHLRAKGDVEVNLFDGKLSVSDIKVFDVLQSVPEVQFTSQWDGIRLDQMGTWMNFGELDGLLKGYAKGVVLQSWLPTNYDFEFRIVPYRHRQIVFSSQAMRNTVKLFAGEDLDRALPGFADWVAFGWLSQLFGGYDVDYVGVSLFAARGSILLKTLDPEEVFKKERKHFILYGPRFKIPIRSERYPVVLDAPGLSNLARHMLKQLGALKEVPTKDEDETDESVLEKKKRACVPRRFL